MIKLVNKIDPSRETVRFVGIRPQRVAELAAKNGIPLYRIKRIDSVTLEAQAPARMGGRMRALAEENGFQAVAVQRRGAFYTFERLKKRAVLWSGVLLALLALTVLSHRVWFVRVLGASDEDAVRSVLREEGIFSWNETIDTRALAQALTKSEPRFLWSSISLRGPIAQVYVKEKPAEEEIGEQADMIVAQKDCLIRNLIVLSGQALVKNGQTVRAGEALIAPQTVDGVLYAPVGRAIAGVFYSASLFMPACQSISVPTGRTQEILAFDLMGISLPQQAPRFAFYRARQEEIDLRGLPLSIQRLTIEELVEEERIYDRESAVKEGEAALTERLRALIPPEAAVTSTVTQVLDAEDGWTVTVTIQTIEEVAVKRSVWDL
ncbi:MAG: sporulation protein YqfD [Clostridia bacterium]|nr:sporulation protein YqfD [Clostridia bacterium]